VDPHLTAIREVLDRIWTSQGREFASFEIVRGGRADPDRWVQYLDGELNVRWPFEAAPGSELPRAGIRLPRGVRVLSWFPGENAVLAAGDLRVDEVALLVADLGRLLAAPDPWEGAECSARSHG